MKIIFKKIQNISDLSPSILIEKNSSINKEIPACVFERARFNFVYTNGSISFSSSPT